ncbi:putative transposase [Burkholderia pseudomallei]|nr:putative transposase [Burkholderia pseudomallei]
MIDLHPINGDALVVAVYDGDLRLDVARDRRLFQRFGQHVLVVWTAWLRARAPTKLSTCVVVIDTFMHSYGLSALPVARRSTSGACSAYSLFLLLRQSPLSGLQYSASAPI